MLLLVYTIKTVITYESIHHSNTKKITTVTANIFGAQLLKKLSEVYLTILEEHYLVGLGFGIYFSKHHKSLFELIDSLSLFLTLEHLYSLLKKVL